MSATSRLALAVLAAAALLGLLGDLLLRETPWGVNAALWTAAVLVAVAALRPSRARRPALLLALPAAAAVAWRDSPVLVALNLAVVAGAVIAAGIRRPARAPLDRYGRGVAEAAGQLAAAPALLAATDVRWKDVPRGRLQDALAVARGLAIAVPLLLLFGGLLASADAVFGELVSRPFEAVAEPVPHLAAFGLAAWTAAGVLRYVLWPRAERRVADEPRGSLGILEIGLVLVLVDLLFLVFVAVQFRTFFGGRELVETTTGLTYAQYARSGFFQLVAVAALVLPLLLATDRLLRSRSRGHLRLFRGLSLGLLALLAVVMASALERMRLYQEVYGLTELRLYTTAFMAWLALIFLWLAVTVLRGRRLRFAAGAAMTAIAAVLALDAINPDALIARTNAARDRPFDGSYASSLSADAVPTLLAVLPQLDPPVRRYVAATLLETWSPPDERDWRSWNLGRTRAWEAVDENRELLERFTSGRGAP
jgi:hypothetical protein